MSDFDCENYKQTFFQSIWFKIKKGKDNEHLDRESFFDKCRRISDQDLSSKFPIPHPLPWFMYEKEQDNDHLH